MTDKNILDDEILGLEVMDRRRREDTEQKLDRYENLLSIEKMDKDRYKLVESNKGTGFRITIFDSNGKIEKELKYK